MRPLALAVAAALCACAGRPGASPPAVASAPTSAAGAPPASRPVDPVTTALGTISRDALLADVAFLASSDLRGRGLYTSDARRTADLLADRLRAVNLTVTLQPIPTVPGQVNVVAVRRGAGPHADEVVIVSAHYDHLGVVDGTLYPGADDNASGVSVLLAMARAVRDLPGGRTIVFLSSGAEEAGLVGASAYVAAPILPLARTVGVINFDMVGRKFFEWTGGLPHTIGAVGLDATLGDAARRAAAAEKVTMLGISPEMLALFGFDGRTDDHVFRKAGVPALHFSTGLHPDYHKPTDTPDRIDGAQLERVARVATRVLVEVAGFEEPPR